MIDLKTIKEIKISEGSVTKITNSSGVVLWEVKSTSEQAPCYYVAKNVSDLPQGLYQTEYDMAYVTSEKCWYALNNKSKWEKYGVIESVSSLDNLTAYDGKLVFNTTDKHEYKYTNNAWTDQGEVSESVVKNYWAECKQDEIELYHITYHWGEGYHIEFESAYNSTSSTNYKTFVDCKFDNDTHGPIEIGEGTDSYYYDQHYPTSTTSNACDTSDYSKRTWIYSAHNANTRYRLKVWNNKIEQHKYDDDSLVTSSTVSWNTHSWYNGLYEMGLHTANSNLIWHAARFYDSDNNLTDEWLVQSDGSIKETLTQTVVQPQSVATGVTVSEYGNMTTYTYPVSYEQYDAPNLNYTECANEAAMKALSCPYEGMKVKLTDTGKKYKFTYNSTTSQYEWVEYSSSLDVDLNNQWVASTKTLDGYNVYMSNSNHNVDNGYASMKFKFNGMPNFKLWINSYAESNYDYTVAWNMDVNYPTSNPYDNSTGVKAHTKGKQYNPTNITAFTEVDYPNDGGEHFVVVTYRKDGSASSNDDRGYVAVKLTLLSTTWVVSSTEFVKKDGKYYEKLTEVGTYEGGATALTGNYKEGNELPVTYKQGTADDYIVVGSGKYYKKYAYVTPKDQEINTGDYIQGDYIGEATLSMKVTYPDGSENKFYGLTSIEQDTAPNKKNAKSIEIYDGVTSIGDNAFYDCPYLTDITLPNSLISIGYEAFEYSTGLTTMTVNAVTPPTLGAYALSGRISVFYVPASSVDKYKSASGWSSYADNIFAIGDAIPAMKVTYTDNSEKIFYNLRTIQSHTDSNKSNAKSVEFYDIVTSIGSNAFDGCSYLTGITFPSSVTSLGFYAFHNCSALTGITLPNSLTNIGYGAFRECPNLTSVIIPNSVTSIDMYAFDGSSKLESVTIQNSTSKLAYNTNAFANISSSAKLYVPSNLLADYQSDSSWTGAFKGGIFEIQIPAMKVTYTDNTEKTFYNLTTIGENSDSNKKKAKNVEIYDDVTGIGYRAFSGCTSLTGVTIGNSVTSIGDDAFYNCTYLTNIAIPNSVTNIGNYAFMYCVRVTSITLSDSLTTIGEGAFKMCASLTSITIPANVTTIGNNVFDSAVKLATITVEATTPPSIGDNFLPTNYLGQAITNTIYVPASSVNAYKSATNWSAFASKIKAIGS